MAYDFSTLNDKELEQLSQDLLNSKFDLSLQNFKSGKDGGIDLRYSSEKKNNEIIVQVKHYLKSGYKLLLKELRQELQKVDALKPNRYIIVTSLSLTARQKDEIKALFVPYIKTSNDVIGQEDLNVYLSEFPNIEKKWFKLWLSSTQILQTIINNGLLSKSLFFDEEIKRNISLYVKVSSFDDAYRIIEDHNYILITGQPGVGKTTLAKLLAYELMAKGFQLIYLDDDIREAENLYDPNPEAKQLFYFDDFLGANYLEIMNPKTTESRFVNFLDRIKKSKNKLLILTTRTTVLKNALSKYEKLNRSKIDLARKEIQLGEYSELEKAKILYNHLFHTSINNEYKKSVFANKNYWKIIKHRNYNPRLIEFFTNENNLIHVAKHDYFQFILDNLDNPEEVWNYAYKYQFSTEDKLLLHSIFTVSNNETKCIQAVFNDFLKSEITNYGHIPQPSPFNNACKNLLDGIIHKEDILNSTKSIIHFINPSIRDFLINYFLNNNEELWRLIKGCSHIEQFEAIKSNIYHLNTSKSISFHNEFLDYLLAIDIYTLKTFRQSNFDYNSLRFCVLITSWFTDTTHETDIDEYTFKIISTKSPTELSDLSTHYFSEIVLAERYKGKVYNWICDNWTEIMQLLIKNSTDEDDLKNMLDLFKAYKMSYGEFIDDYDNKCLLLESLTQFADERTEEWVSDARSRIYSASDVSDIKQEIIEERQKIFSKFALDDENYNERYFFTSLDMNDLIEENNNPKFQDWKENRIVEKMTEHTDETKMIDDLFS